VFRYGRDVVDNDLRELLGGPFGGLDPWGQLTVPDEGVAAEKLALLLGEVGGDVALCEVEDAALGFREKPLVEKKETSLAPLLR
jgi:hypothetical protein